MGVNSEQEDISTFIKGEEDRLEYVCRVVDKYIMERGGKLAIHDKKMDTYKKERMDAVDFREKDELNLQMRDLTYHNPRKYLPGFQHSKNPYLAGLVIQDTNKRIGTQHILFGKQSMTDGSKVIVVDWRKAAISRLYYEWDEGEEYEENINGQERTGIIQKKISYGIRNRSLESLKTGEWWLRKNAGVWGQGIDSAPGKPQNATMSHKENEGDYSLTDIVSLISREQFRLITQNIEGCLHLSGGAGCGKTTVALHRLSFLMFNEPESFRPQRCMVVMFNRSLCDYVKQTSTDLLGNDTSVTTFHAWATKALLSLGVNVRFSANYGKGLATIKKSSGMQQALAEYVASNKRKKEMSAIEDLGRFYACSERIEKHCKPLGNAIKAIGAESQRLADGATELPFDDAGILLLLEQLRGGQHEYQGALNWYDHIVIDEAQDLSACELKSLFYATSDKRSMTICADAHQKILDFVDGSGFSAFQMDMQKQGMQAGSLDVSYRSTAQIMDLANRVANRESVEVVNEGPDPRFHYWNNKEETLEHLRRSLAALMAKEPQSLTAVICRYKKEAQEVFQALKGVPGLRLQTSSLSFEPGVLVTNIHQVKGLEFSGVIMWNPTHKAYPYTEIGRNLLYVGLTRASNRLAVYHFEGLSGLLKG
jgi:DNA helicase IV